MSSCFLEYFNKIAKNIKDDVNICRVAADTND